VLVAIPLFILMGEFILQSGLSARFYRGVATWLERVPGGLLHSNVAASSIFAAVSGSSVATVAAVGTVAVPEMEKRGYDKGLTLSTLIGGGSVGMLIPPSIAALIYAAMVEESAAKMFIAGLVPGLILSVCYSVYAAIRVMRKPSLAPASGPQVSWAARGRGALDASPVLALMVLILITIYLGIATPTEAAAIACALAFVFSAWLGKMDWAAIKRAVVGTVKTTSMLIFIVVGAQILSFAIVNAGITRQLTSFVVDLGLPSFGFFLVILVMYILLGMVVDGLSMMLLTLPVLYPVVIELGYDPLLFGVLLIIFIELGQVTPPVGLILFVLRGISPSTPMGVIVRAAVPIAVIIIAVSVLVFLFPQLALYLTQFV
jgi:tripartite ATP-independent transporter DctM subunit